MPRAQLPPQRDALLSQQEPIALHSADGACARLTPFGAQLLSWCPAGGGERLFMSPRAVFDDRSPIRGGVPLVFPQFSTLGPLPAHGFARTASWTLRTPHTPGQPARLSLGLQASPQTLALWPHRFEAEFSVLLGGLALEMQLTLWNRDSQPWTFQAALHTYLAVDDLDALRLHGLQGCAYRERGAAAQGGEQAEAALAFRGEVDRLYPNAPGRLRLAEPGRELQISQQGFADCVVWNPGPLRAAAIADLGAGPHRRMVCVEAASVAQPLRLAPGERWQGSQRLEALPAGFGPEGA